MTRKSEGIRMSAAYSTEELCIMVIMTSLLGWCLENIWLIFRRGYFDNRSMTLPFLLGYGLAIMGFYLLAGTPDAPGGILVRYSGCTEQVRYRAYFLCAFLGVSAGEIVLGTAVERICGFCWWDYSELPLHMTRYTSILTSIGFAGIATFFMGRCFTPLMERIRSMELIQHRALIYGMVIVLVLDMLLSFHRMYRLHGLQENWRITIWKAKELSQLL